MRIFQRHLAASHPSDPHPPELSQTRHRGESPGQVRRTSSSAVSRTDTFSSQAEKVPLLPTKASPQVATGGTSILPLLPALPSPAKMRAEAHARAREQILARLEQLTDGPREAVGVIGCRNYISDSSRSELFRNCELYGSTTIMPGINKRLRESTDLLQRAARLGIPILQQTHQALAASCWNDLADQLPVLFRDCGLTATGLAHFVALRLEDMQPDLQGEPEEVYLRRLFLPACTAFVQQGEVEHLDSFEQALTQLQRGRQKNGVHRCAVA